MCGICGIIDFNGLTKEELDFFSTMLVRTQKRGTDASGVGTQRGRTIVGNVPAEKIVQYPQYQEVLTSALGNKWIVGHTRHATRGDPANLINDHPLFIRDDTYVVHNGVVSREDMELPEDELKTDSYIIVDAIKKSWVEGDLYTSVKNAYKRFKGSASICVFSPKEIVLARNINPLRYAITPTGSIVFASESDFFPEYRPFIIMEDEWIMGWDASGQKKEEKLDVVKYTYSRSYDWESYGRTNVQTTLVDEDDEEEEDDEDNYEWKRDPITPWIRNLVYRKKKKNKGWEKENKRHREAYYKGRQDKYKPYWEVGSTQNPPRYEKKDGRWF